MTTQEAYRILHPDTSAEAVEEIKYYAGFNEDSVINTINEACKIACEALAKQIPMKPKFVHPLQEDDGGAYVCGRCGYGPISKEDSHCWHGCGQMIDWSVLDEK